MKTVIGEPVNPGVDQKSIAVAEARGRVLEVKTITALRL